VFAERSERTKTVLEQINDTSERTNAPFDHVGDDVARRRRQGNVQDSIAGRNAQISAPRTAWQYAL